VKVEENIKMGILKLILGVVLITAGLLLIYFKLDVDFGCLFEWLKSIRMCVKPI
jgi:hypothetical protein